MANIQFEDIEPWIDENQGDTGLTARQKLKRNFDKIKAWIDALQTDRFFDEVTLENGSKAVKLKTSYTGLFTDGFLAALGVGSEQGGGGGGSVTSIGMSVPQGFTVSPSSISQSGTFAVGFASGYSLPSNNLQASWTAKQDAISDLATIRQNAANGNTAYESLNGYALKSYLEGNWLVKSYEAEDSQGNIVNGDWIPGDIILEDGVLKTTYYQILMPTATSDLTNDSGFITSSALSGYATQSWVQNTALSGFATEDYVDTELASAISDMATETWVGNNYLPLTGGTLTGNLTIGNVTIYSTGSNGGINSILIGDYAYIGDGNMAGGIGIKAKNSNVQAGIKFFTNEDKSCGELLARADMSLTYEGNLIWHAGNDGSGSGLDADTVDGYHAYQMMTKHAGENEYDNTAGLKIITVSNRTDIFDDNVPRWGSVLQWSNAYYQPSEVNSGNWYNQLFGINQDGGRLYYRNRENGGNWKTLHKIAYTTDNVASATKLATARNLWGQPFDGSGDISGSLLGVTDVHLTGQLVHDNAWYFGPGAGDGSGFYNLYRTGVGLVYSTNPTNGIVTYYQGLAVADGRFLTLNGLENNAICNVANANGAITVNRFENATAIRNALSFQWYGTDWQIGNIRGGATNSQGFGITKSNDTLVFAINETRAYIPGNILTNGYVQIGNARLVWDSTNNAIRVEGVSGTANLYATGGLAALGIGSGSSGSVTNLTVTDTLRIKAGSSGYHSIENELINGNNYLRLSGDSGIDLDSDTVIGGTLSVDGVGGLHVEDGVEAYGDITAGGDLTVGGDVKVDYNGNTYRLNVQAAINAGILTQVTA